MEKIAQDVMWPGAAICLEVGCQSMPLLHCVRKNALKSNWQIKIDTHLYFCIINNHLFTIFV